MRWLDGITVSMGMNGVNSGIGRTGKPGVLQSVESQRSGYDLMTEQQQQSHLCFLLHSKLLEVLYLKNRLNYNMHGVDW